MATTVVTLEVQNEYLSFLEEFIQKFKAKKVRAVEKDDTEMTKEEFFC
ncbi:hypothetical protein AB4865_11770 [Capnocytophaga sp. ARDL2]